jgi:SAM-dependent methyltransferase
MIETIEYKGSVYPKLQAEGFAAQYAFPFAQKFCKGIGFDIGCKKKEWAYPGAWAIDPVINYYDAFNLPNDDENYLFVDYIFSSHCLEHLNDWVAALDYWAKCLKSGGTLFLYLPNMDYQHYWQPQNNRKHKHYLNPNILQSYFNDRIDVWQNDFVTVGMDLNASFYAIAEKI